MWLWLKYAPNSWFCKCCREALPSVLYSHWEKKKREKHNSLVFLCLSSTSLAKTFFFVCLWLSWATKYLISLIPTFLKTTVGVPTYLGEHRPFHITVHMCRKHEFSGLYCVKVQLNFFKTKEALWAKGVKHNSWSRFGKRNFKRQHLQGETMNTTTIPGFPIREYKVSHSMCFLSELCRPR